MVGGSSPYLTVREAASLIGISKQSIRRLAGRGVLAARKRGHDWSIVAASARAYAARERRPGRPRTQAVTPAEIDVENARRVAPEQGWDALLEQLNALMASRSDVDLRASAGRELAEALVAAGYDHLAELVYDGLEIRE